MEGGHLVEKPESFAHAKVIDAALLEGVDSHEFRRLVAPGQCALEAACHLSLALHLRVLLKRLGIIGGAM